MSVAFRRESDERTSRTQVRTTDRPRTQSGDPARAGVDRSRGRPAGYRPGDGFDRGSPRLAPRATLLAYPPDHRRSGARAGTGARSASAAASRSCSAAASGTVEIVGTDEADPAEGRIGFQAPLARAVIGAEVGETLEFGGKADAITVVRVG